MDSREQRPVIFLDRDGVLIENREHYVRTWDDVDIFPQAVEACLALRDAGFALVVVTNQSAVSRKAETKDGTLMTLEYVTALHERILDSFRQAGVEFLKSYICPHAPQDNCRCRKPLPGMIEEAREDFGIDLSQSFLVGDASTDLQAAEAAGVKGILIRTGRGKEEESKARQIFGNGVLVYENLRDAALFIIESSEVRA